VHNVAAILCLLLAIVLSSVIVEGWGTMPGWVIGLAVVTTLVLIASAARTYASGAARRRKAEGPRTRIVLADVPAPPPRAHARRRASGE
jgi:hypothetical protein